MGCVTAYGYRVGAPIEASGYAVGQRVVAYGCAVIQSVVAYGYAAVQSVVASGYAVGQRVVAYGYAVCPISAESYIIFDKDMLSWGAMDNRVGVTKYNNLTATGKWSLEEIEIEELL